MVSPSTIIKFLESDPEYIFRKKGEEPLVWGNVPEAGNSCWLWWGDDYILKMYVRRDGFIICSDNGNSLPISYDMIGCIKISKGYSLRIFHVDCESWFVSYECNRIPRTRRNRYKSLEHL